MNQNTLYLLLIWLVQSALVVLLAYWNPNHFTTIDSGYYLESATHLLQGEGYRYLENGQLVWNGIFPIGYPSAIALVAIIGGVSPLWASKVVNMIVSAAFLYLLRHWFGERKALVTGCVLLFGQFVKLWAHTWSEPLFLLLLFAWAYLSFNTPLRYLSVFLLGLALMLVRYAGVFIIPFSLFIILINFRKGKYSLAKIQLYSTIGWSLAMGVYLSLNLYKSGAWYGGARFEEGSSFITTAVLFGQGLLNELFLFRDTDFNQPDLLFFAGLTAQGLLTILFLINKEHRSLQPSYLVRFANYTALGYLVFPFLIRLFSPFDAPGYRLMAPFSFLFFWGILFRIKEANFAGIRILIGSFALMASWLQLVPQTQVEDKLKPLMQWLGIA